MLGMRQKWLRQPDGPISLTNDFAQVAKAVFLLTPGRRDLVLNRPVVRSGSVYADGHYGTGIYHDASSDYTDLITNVADLPLNNTSLILHLANMPGGDSDPGTFGTRISSATTSSMLGAFCPNANGSVYWDFGGAIEGVSRLSVATSVPKGSTSVWVFSTGPGGMRIVRNGELLASNSGNPTRDNVNVLGWGLGRHYTNLSDGLLAYLVSFTSRQLPLDYELAISRAPYGEIFTSPKKKIFTFYSAGADTQLSGGATGSALSSAGLSTVIRMAGASLSVSTATGQISTGIPLAASTAAISVSNGLLITAITLNGAASALSTATANITTSIKIAAQAVSTASATGNIGGASGAIQGLASAQALLSGNLSTAIRFNGALTGVASATGVLTTAISMNSSASGLASASASLTTAIRLSAIAQVAVSASGSLSGGSAPSLPRVGVTNVGGYVGVTNVGGYVGVTTVQ